MFVLLQGKLPRAPAVVFAVGWLISGSPHAELAREPATLRPAELRGKMIYTTGRNAAGRGVFFRLLGAGEGVLPAKGVVCASCHGRDGRGGREGDIVVPDITYATLARPLPASPLRHRGRAPYTDATLARAITHGIDSSGQQLHALMPRWALSSSELEDLLKYLKQLGRE